MLIYDIIIIVFYIYIYMYVRGKLFVQAVTC